jgi:Cu+-exporting ATPase
MINMTKLVLALGLASGMSLGLQADEQGAACSVAAKSACSVAEGSACSVKAEAGLTKVQYKVSGMSCTSCEGKIAKALTKVEGVSNPSACAQSGLVKVAYAPGTVKDKQVIAAIEKAGYKVKAETVEWNVDGMSCGACSDKVVAALAKLDGVKEKQVCHVGKKAVVTFDPHTVSAEKVLAAIGGTGFKVVQ